ncbi:MAG: hypothetical protein ABIS69_00545 [Sediminibacterium sp.]
MHHHTSYRGRTHIQKENGYKPKLSAEEKALRKARKDLNKLFPFMRLHYIQNNLGTKFHIADSRFPIAASKPPQTHRK